MTRRAHSVGPWALGAVLLALASGARVHAQDPVATPAGAASASAPEASTAAEPAAADADAAPAEAGTDPVAASAPTAEPAAGAPVLAAEAESDAETITESSAAAEAPAAEPSRDVRVTIALGAGGGTRSYSRPVSTGVEALDTTMFAALDLGVVVTAWPDERLSLDVGIRYQTSLGMTVQLEPPFALPERLHVRSERLELGVAPVWRTSASRRALRFAFPVGFTLRMFWPEVHETVPGWYLAGPHARIEVIAPLWDWLDLRFGPELFWVAAVHPALRADGTENMGVGAGMEAALVFLLGGDWALDASFRQAHAFVSGVDGAADFVDTERYFTLRLRGAL